MTGQNAAKPDEDLSPISLPPPAECGSGYIYVIEFSNGTIKVGNTTDPASRLGSHASTASAFNITADRVWISSPHATYIRSENRLIEATAHIAGGRRRREYFSGVSFETVRDLAQSIASTTVRDLARAGWECAEAGDRDGAVRAMCLATASVSAAEALIDGYMDALRAEADIA